MSRRANTGQRRSQIVQALLATMTDHGAAGLAPGVLH